MRSHLKLLSASFLTLLLGGCTIDNNYYSDYAVASPAPAPYYVETIPAPRTIVYNNTTVARPVYVTQRHPRYVTERHPRQQYIRRDTRMSMSDLHKGGPMARPMGGGIAKGKPARPVSGGMSGGSTSEMSGGMSGGSTSGGMSGGMSGGTAQGQGGGAVPQYPNQDQQGASGGMSGGSMSGGMSGGAATAG